MFAFRTIAAHNANESVKKALLASRVYPLGTVTPVATETATQAVSVILSHVQGQLIDTGLEQEKIDMRADFRKEVDAMRVAFTVCADEMRAAFAKEVTLLQEVKEKAEAFFTPGGEVMKSLVETIPDDQPQAPVIQATPGTAPQAKYLRENMRMPVKKKKQQRGQKVSLQELSEHY